MALKSVHAIAQTVIGVQQILNTSSELCFQQKWSQNIADGH